MPDYVIFCKQNESELNHFNLCLTYNQYGFMCLKANGNGYYVLKFISIDLLL